LEKNRVLRVVVRGGVHSNVGNVISRRGRNHGRGQSTRR
jgi:hypothetical protein